VIDERHLPRSHRDMVALVDAHPLAWVISRDFQATLLPLLAETDDEGGLCALLGHIPVRNPQRLALERDPDALILFLGPNDYISPRLVSNPQWGPTWNYEALRVRAQVEFVGTRPTWRCGCSLRTSNLAVTGRWREWSRGTSA